jgi:hypothetical protein
MFRLTSRGPIGPCELTSMPRAKRRQSYATDLTYMQWGLIAPMIPEAKPGGRPRKAPARELVNAIESMQTRGGWSLLE